MQEEQVDHQSVVFYHSPCMDGQCAAWVYSMLMIPSWYHPINYGDSFPIEGCNDLNVVFLDFSLKRNLMEEVVSRSRSITILDHHKTAEAELQDLQIREHDTLVFDMNKSGAMLTWEHYHKEEQPPRIVEYVQDRDLWLFKLPDSKLINDWIAAYYEKNFSSWDCMEADLAKSFESVLSKAHAIRKYKDKAIDLTLPHAHTIKLDGHDGLAVNQSSANLISEIAGELAKKADFGACYFRTKEGKWIVSLRSSGDIDVSEIARHRGGGGHKNAAGFECDTPPEIVNT